MKLKPLFEDNQAKIKVAIKALKTIAEMKTERDEWDGAKKYEDCQKLAAEALKVLGVTVRNSE